MRGFERSPAGRRRPRKMAPHRRRRGADDVLPPPRHARVNWGWSEGGGRIPCSSCFQPPHGAYRGSAVAFRECRGAACCSCLPSRRVMFTPHLVSLRWGVAGRGTGRDTPIDGPRPLACPAGPALRPPWSWSLPGVFLESRDEPDRPAIVPAGRKQGRSDAAGVVHSVVPSRTSPAFYFMLNR